MLTLCYNEEKNWGDCKRDIGMGNIQKELIQEMEDPRFREKYENACLIVRSKLEEVNFEISQQKGWDYMNDISYRVKTPQSCLKKMLKKGYPLNKNAAEEHLCDIAGVRAVCYFLDDVYQLADILIQYETFTFIKMKDYIRKPKSSGYQSLHLIVSVPVGDEQIKVEIQIRTQAMDFWSDIEHRFIYKTENQDLSEYEEEFLKVSKSLQKIDKQMLKIRRKMQDSGLEFSSPHMPDKGIF